jgi:hypothetical protein
VEGSEELSLLAEIAVALAGFSGIVVAIQSRDRAHPWDTYRAAALLITGFSMLVEALLPSAIHSFGVAGPNLWRLSSVLCVLIVMAPIIPMLRITPTDFASSPYYRLITPAIIGAAVVSIVAFSINALAFGTMGSFSFFHLGVLMNIPSTALQFLAVIVIRPPVESPAV